ncbi:MAG: hypothetical protein UT05_C0002G0074 [Parcubacteria group bacterium GW2011_GWF2_38_76]|nr:MAG: hypothetical protein UT05_C0002G0074 [Parcubacteria group bacterium GW2011_GWF2_38_76]HBM45768.1 hypothetical protein [Patescibacteria group bacterium]
MEFKENINLINKRARDLYQNAMFIKSILVGFVALAVDLSLIFIFTDVFLWNYWISANIAFIITILVNFLLQKFWTFGDNVVHRTKAQLFKFFTLSLLNLFANSILMYVFVSLFGIWYLLAQTVITAILFLFNFVVYRFYIFV